MSFVTTRPGSPAAGQLHGVGSATAARKATAVTPTTGVVPAAADEVSALTATQFAARSAVCQVASAQAGAAHDLFVSILGASAGSYSATGAANMVAVG